jgi:uncharacterized protein YecE (DUF72 family)
MNTGDIRAGIGGWTFEPWRGTFYPKGVRQAGELAYAASRLRTIEVNGTYYSTQKPGAFANWAAQTPDDFVFSVKASRFCTHRKVLAEVGPAMAKFFDQGLADLGPKLGPILWQFMATKRFDAEDFARYLDLFPTTLNGQTLRHVIEARHESFLDARFVALCLKRGIAICLTDDAGFPMIAEPTADFTYVRLMRGNDETATCYDEAGLKLWAGRCRRFAAGETPDDLPRVGGTDRPAGRDVFVYFIKNGKVRAPAGAMALQAMCGA